MLLSHSSAVGSLSRAKLETNMILHSMIKTYESHAVPVSNRRVMSKLSKLTNITGLGKTLPLARSNIFAAGQILFTFVELGDYFRAWNFGFGIVPFSP